jgi:hypothetical protein
VVLRSSFQKSHSSRRLAQCTFPGSPVLGPLLFPGVPNSALCLFPQHPAAWHLFPSYNISPAQNIFKRVLDLHEVFAKEEETPRREISIGSFRVAQGCGGGDCGEGEVLQTERPLRRVTACRARVPRRERQSIGSAIPVESSTRCGSHPGARSGISRRFGLDGQDPRSVRRPCMLSPPPHWRSPIANSAARQAKSTGAGLGSGRASPR